MANTIDFKLRTPADLKGVNALKQSLNEDRKELSRLIHDIDNE